MLAYFIFGIFLLLALVVGSRSLMTMAPEKLARALKIAAAIALAAAAAFFALSGRFAFAPPLALAAVWLLRRRPLFGSRPSAGQQSSVETEWLSAALDHDSGHMDALVKQGRFEGRRLSDLSPDQLNALMDELHHDQESRLLLESFIDRNFEGGFDDTDQRGKAKEGSGISSRRDALDILELEDGASEADIRAAHRRLMKKFHPDHGGSAYMAAKLNEAKEFLLGK